MKNNSKYCNTKVFETTFETCSIHKQFRSQQKKSGYIKSFLFVTVYKNCQVITTDNLFQYLAQLFDLISRTNSFWHRQGQNKQRVFHGVFSLKSDKRRLSFFRLTPSVTLITSKESSLLLDVFQRPIHLDRRKSETAN